MTAATMEPGFAHRYEEMLDAIVAARRIIEAEQLAKAPVEAPRFNALDFLRCDELGLSELIRWLLDPRGSHAQGDVFLRKFIAHFKIRCDSDITRATARCEVSTHTIEAWRRRIDVHVRINDFVIAIENKPFAAWQPGQVAAYLEHLNNSAPAGHCLILLKAGDGEVPVEQLASKEAKRLVGLGQLVDSHYDMLGGWVRRCADICMAPRVTFFLGELAAYIDREFNVTTAERAIAVAITRQTPERLDAALELLGAKREILRTIHDDLVQEVSRLGAARGFEVISVEGARNTGISSTAWSIEITCGADFWFYLVYHWSQGVTPWIGLWRERLGTRLASAAVAQLERRLGPGKQDTNWAWWHWLDEEQLGTPDTADFTAVWKALKNVDVIAPRIIEWAEEAFAALDS